jgi:ketosteroid isomerase-like protein
MKPVFITLLMLSIVLSLSAQDSDTDRILAVVQHQVKGWNNGDIETFMQGYARTDSLRFASGGKVTYGWTTMLERYRKGYPTRSAMGTLTFTDITVELLPPGAAMVFGTWRLKREKDEPWGLFTLLFKNINGEWRIVHDHTSSGN